MRKLLIGSGVLLLTGILTIVGFYSSLGQTNPSNLSIALWFPWAAMIKRLTGSDIALLIATTLQFPLIGALTLFLGKNFGWKLTIVGVVVAHLTLSLLVMRLTRATINL